MSETSGATPQAFGGAASRSVAYHDLAAYLFAAGGTVTPFSATVAQGGQFAPGAVTTSTAATTGPVTTLTATTGTGTTATTITPWPCVGETFPTTGTVTSPRP